MAPLRCHVFNMNGIIKIIYLIYCGLGEVPTIKSSPTILVQTAILADEMNLELSDVLNFTKKYVK